VLRGCLFASLGIVGIVIVLVIVGLAVGSHNGTKTGATGQGPPPGVTSQSSPGGTATQAAGIGDPVRDGKFQFTITKVTHAKLSF
jgi:hypothetical protein